MDCFSLNNLDLSSLKQIEYSVFSRCISLKRVKCNLNNEEMIKEEYENLEPDCDCKIFYKWNKIVF